MVTKDKRNPDPSSEMTTKVMKANKGKNTKPELAVRQMLREAGHPGYRLNGFPDNWTDTGMSQRQRYFTMGNALVVPLIQMMGETLDAIWKQ